MVEKFEDVFARRLRAFANQHKINAKERVVLPYLIQGYQFDAIEKVTSVKRRTVKYRTRSIREKCGAADRFELTRKFYETELRYV